MTSSDPPTIHWLLAGADIFPKFLAAISEARESVQLETYIYSDGAVGREVREALRAAAQRGVRVQVLVDAIGSWLLPADFFQPVVAAGGEVRRFNPIHPLRFGVRDHRKLLICDEAVVFIGGFNLADEYCGDGISCGWCDLGIQIEDPVLAARLAASFIELFALADFEKRSWLQFLAFRRRGRQKKIASGGLLLCQPGRGASPFQLSLYRDLNHGRTVRIVSPYFLPTRRLRRDLIRVSRLGGRVQLILPAKTDVTVSRFAAWSLYRRLLKSGIEIYEYQPQILHAKLICIDAAVYVGSSNLDIRSLNLNYELMLRLEDPASAASARAIVERLLDQSRKIELRPWLKTQTIWQRLKNRLARLLLARIDPFVALYQFRALTKRKRS